MALPDGVPQRHFSTAVLPRPELSVFCQRPWVPFTACIVLAFRVAALACLTPTPCTGILGCVFCQWEEGWHALRSGERMEGGGAPLTPVLQPPCRYSGDLRVGSGSQPRPTSKVGAPEKALR